MNWNLILEYLKVILSWPPVVLLALYYFLFTQREPLARLIDRVKQVDFPGGGFKTDYMAPTEEIGGQKNIPEIVVESKKIQPGDPQKTDSLEQDFNTFIYIDFQSNAKIINLLIDRAWKKFKFPFLKPPEEIVERAKSISNAIPIAVLEDLRIVMDFLTGKKRPSNRKDLMEVYIKSKFLINYFQNL